MTLSSISSRDRWPGIQGANLHAILLTYTSMRPRLDTRHAVFGQLFLFCCFAPPHFFGFYRSRESFFFCLLMAT